MNNTLEEVADELDDVCNHCREEAVVDAVILAVAKFHEWDAVEDAEEPGMFYVWSGNVDMGAWAFDDEGNAVPVF